MGASVKIMLSYDYCHFEICLGDDNCQSSDTQMINAMRKDAQRLADEAVRQYKKAKELANKRENGVNEKKAFEFYCNAILKKEECDRTIKEIAALKQYQDENWQDQFNYDYDYEDDEI